MKNFRTFLIIALIIMQSCKNDDCENKDCFTPPSSFDFELVDKLTGENLFTNGVFNSSDIKVVDIDNNEDVNFTFIDENDINILSINSIGWKTEKVNYQIKIENNLIFELSVNAQRLNGDCCDYTEFTEIKISNLEYERDHTSGVYKLFVE
jgi:hypothetical protein